MNYFEHHIGDYDQATAHLTACEDGIYSRLIRWYMAGEQPLPSDVATIQRRVRAHTRDEKTAVKTILGEFFELRDDGYHQHRCDEEIARFQDKQRKAKASAEARWSKGSEQSGRNANASTAADANGMRTHSEGNAPRARPQTPDTKHQSPDTSLRPATTEVLGEQGAQAPQPARPAAAVGQALRRAGVDLTRCSLPDPRLDELMRTGATVEELEAVARESVAKGISKPVPWIAATMAGRRREAAATPRKTAGRAAAPTADEQVSASMAKAQRVAAALGHTTNGAQPPAAPAPELIDG